MKMFALSDMVSFSKSFNFILDLYVFRDCSIKTRANKLRANKKLIKNFDLLRSCIDYRPLDTGNEQMFGLDAFMTNMTTQVGETASSVSSMAQQIESTAQFVRVATPRFVNAADSVSSFADIVPKLTETLESITKLSNSSTDTLSKMKPLIDQAVNKIDPVKNIFDNLKKNWLAITACITQISSAKSILDLSCSLVIILNLLGLDTTVIENKIFL
jgi:methyl-accepting chemotaxis protein